MSLEALRGKIMPFHPAAHAQKPHPGQVRTADCIYTTLADSDMIVQDAEVEKPADRGLRRRCRAQRQLPRPVHRQRHGPTGHRAGQHVQPLRPAQRPAARPRSQRRPATVPVPREPRPAPGAHGRPVHGHLADRRDPSDVHADVDSVPALDRRLSGPRFLRPQRRPAHPRYSAKLLLHPRLRADLRRPGGRDSRPRNVEHRDRLYESGALLKALPKDSRAYDW